MKLHEITWPVYKLVKERPLESEGVLYYVFGDKYYILDDKTLNGNNLALRRLELLSKNISLFKLKHALFYLGDFLKLVQPKLWFIDSSGKIFTYTKSRYVSLVCRKITNIIPTTGTTILEVEGINHRFKCLFTPMIEEKYAGLLNIGGGYIFYGLYKEPFKESRRMI